MTEWTDLRRPGFLGKDRDKILAELNTQYGKDYWRFAWKFNQERLSFLLACQIYEDAYFMDSINREDLWTKLRREAKNVYDHQESNILSGFDYTIQEGKASHLQDIAIRRIFLRRGWEFEGNELIQIRSHNGFWGKELSPGKVVFHLPELIESPPLKGWWNKNSIEDFYQSNKYLQIRVD